MTDQDYATPSISVLMPVYNGADTLARAMDSILCQTYSDFEFIAIDDGSTDNTSDILARYAKADSRVVFIRQDNIGLTHSLNKGIKLAKGRFIARQDADDYSFPDRLARQHSIMQESADIVLCGGNCMTVHPDQNIEYEWGWLSEEHISAVITLKTPFAHSTAFFRTDAAVSLGGYDENLRTAQDMDLWNRMSSIGRVVMTKEVVAKRYVLPTSISARKRWRQARDAMAIRKKYSSASYAILLYSTIRSVVINAAPPRLIQWLKTIKG